MTSWAWSLLEPGRRRPVLPALELTKGSKMVDEGDVKDVLADLSFLKLAATLHRAFYRSGRRVSN